MTGLKPQSVVTRRGHCIHQIAGIFLYVSYIFVSLIALYKLLIVNHSKFNLPKVL